MFTNIHKEPGEFDIEILKDLVSQGYSGDELIKQFKIQSKNIKKAVNTMLKEADAIAAGVKPAANFEDIFNLDD
jgi:hypothetical protein